MSVLRSAIERLGLNERQALKKSGISTLTFQVLLGGGVTLPCLALTVGRNLGLTLDEVKALGKPLDAEAFTKAKASFQKHDADEDWWKGYEGERDMLASTVWLSTEKLTGKMIARKIGGIADFVHSVTAMPNADSINKLMRETARMRHIFSLADALGCKPTDIMCSKPEEAVYAPKRAFDPEAVTELMHSKEVSIQQMAHDTHIGTETLCRLLRKGAVCFCNPNIFTSIADYLGVTVNDISYLTAVITGGGTRK